MEARTDPNAIIAGFQKWGLEAIVVCNLYHDRQPTTRVVCASGMGVAYLLAHPAKISTGKSCDVISWAKATFGQEYYDGHTQAFATNIPIKYWRHWKPEGRELDGYLDGLECRRLIEFHGIKVIGEKKGFPECQPKPFDPATDTVFEHSSDPPVQGDSLPADIQGE